MNHTNRNLQVRISFSVILTAITASLVCNIRQRRHVVNCENWLPGRWSGITLDLSLSRLTKSYVWTWENLYTYNFNGFPDLIYPTKADFYYHSLCLKFGNGWYFLPADAKINRVWLSLWCTTMHIHTNFILVALSKFRIPDQNSGSLWWPLHVAIWWSLYYRFWEFVYTS